MTIISMTLKRLLDKAESEETMRSTVVSNAYEGFKAITSTLPGVQGQRYRIHRLRNDLSQVRTTVRQCLPQPCDNFLCR